MKKLLIFLHIIGSSIAFAQTPNCTLLQKTPTGMQITNKGMCATKYRIERTGYGDSITATVGKDSILRLNLAWCDTLRATPVTQCPCTCNQSTATLYFHCGTLAEHFTIQAERSNDVVRLWITPITLDGVSFYRVHYGTDVLNVSAVGRVVGVPFLTLINIKK